MSPEQAEGKQAGPQSDVFALGCVLAYAATGASRSAPGTRPRHCTGSCTANLTLPGSPPACWIWSRAAWPRSAAARPELPALAAALAGRTSVTSASALSFWPRSVTSHHQRVPGAGDGRAGLPARLRPVRSSARLRPVWLSTRRRPGAALYQPYPSSKPGPLAGPPVPYPGLSAPVRRGRQARQAGPAPSMLAAARAMYAGAANSAILTVIASPSRIHAAEGQVRGRGAGRPAASSRRLATWSSPAAWRYSLWLCDGGVMQAGTELGPPITSSALFGIGVFSGLEYVAREPPSAAESVRHPRLAHRPDGHRAALAGSLKRVLQGSELARRALRRFERGAWISYATA